MKNLKVIFITPHLSTGGAPQYLLKKIQSLKDSCEIYCVEYANITGGVLVVQRNQIDTLLEKNLITLGDDKFSLINIINDIEPDIIHFEEMPEYFCDHNLARLIYVENRKYKIVETSHDSSFDIQDKIFFPDKFAFVSEYQKKLFSPLGIESEVVEYPIEYKTKTNREQSLTQLGLDPNKIHFLNVGLFTWRKNQAEIIKYAKELLKENVQFHFVGNQADNFKDYWKPLMDDFPENCKWWGERKDTDTFYNAMDVFLFASKGSNNDKETSPLVLKEAIGWKMPVLMYNLDVYCGMYDKFSNITYLKNSFEDNLSLIRSFLKSNYFSVSFDREALKINISICKKHEALKTFNYRIIDYVTKLTFQPIGIDIGFDSAPFYCKISPEKNEHNGIIVEFFDSTGFVFESYNFPENIKNHYSPVIYPTSEIFYDGSKINLQSDPLDKSSFWTYKEVFINKIYDHIDVGDVVVDVGANLGFFSIFAAKHGASKVFALEPVSKTFSFLEHNTAGIDKIKLYNVGLSSENKTTKIRIDPFASSTSSINQNQSIKNAVEEEITLISISNFIKESHISFIDYLKLDCEGTELEIINSLDEDFLSSKIRKISLEVHVSLIGEEGYNKIINKLKSCLFEINVLSKNSDLAFIYAEKVFNSPKISVEGSKSDNISVLVQSCDAYEKFWEGWYKSMKRYWPWELNWNVYFMTEEKMPFFSTDNRIKILNYSINKKKEDYSSRWIWGLKQMSSDYVFYFQEDMWPILKLDPLFLTQGLEMMSKFNWNGLKIQEKLWGNLLLEKTNYFINNVRVLKMKNDSEWTLSHTPSFWNKDFLLKNLDQNQDPWTNEIFGTRKLYDNYSDSKIYFLNERWYYQFGASQNGNMNPFCKEYLEYLNYTEALDKQFNIYG